MTDRDVHHILIYDYVENMAERRGPYRPAHLERLLHERNTGRIAFVGPFDPPTGAAIVFRGVDRAHVEAFVAGDPYHQAGLITGYRIERWALLQAQ